MVASCVKLHLDEVIAFTRGKESVGEASELGSWGGFTLTSDVAFILLFVAYEPLLHGIRYFGWTSSDDRPVALGYVPLTEEFIHPTESFTCLGEDHQPSYGTV